MSVSRVPWAVSQLGPPLLVGAAILLVHSMPTGFLAFLAAWTLLSLPLGMLVGHCSLDGS